MPFGLRFRVNQGLPIVEHLNGKESNLDIIVRKINYRREGQEVDFELRQGEHTSRFSLGEGESFPLSGESTLILPSQEQRENEPQRVRKSVFIYLHAPRYVEFGERQTYSE